MKTRGGFRPSRFLRLNYDAVLGLRAARCRFSPCSLLRAEQAEDLSGRFSLWQRRWARSRAALPEATAGCSTPSGIA